MTWMSLSAWNPFWVKVLQAIGRLELPAGDIKRPPCELCRWWEPQTRMMDGEPQVSLCQNMEMYQDFSCYTARTAEDEQQLAKTVTHPHKEN